MENKFSALLDAGTSYYSGLLNTDKEKAIIEANEEKIRSLQEYQKQREAAQARYEATLIGKLGLDPNGVVGSGINLAANAGTGALSTISGHVGSGIHTLWGASNLADIPDEALAARKRMLDGTASDAEKELLDAPVGQSKQKPSHNRWQNDVEAAKPTNLDRIRAVEKAQRNAQAVRDALDFSKYVYQDNKEGLVNDLKAGAADDLAKVSKGWDQLKNYEDLAGWGNIASGLAGSTAEIGKAALKNPRGALGYVAENAPQIAAAFLGKGASLATNLLYGLDNYDRGLQAYSKDKGQIAPSNERTKMQALSAAAVAAETLGDKFVVDASKVGSDLVSGIGSAAGNVSRKGFKDTLINSANAIDNTAIARTGKAIIGGATGEYLTEGVQTWLENETQGKPTSLEDAYVGAAIGAIIGGTTSGSVHAAGEVRKLTGSTIAKTQDKLQEAAVTKAAVDAAAKTGDVSVFTNPESPVHSYTKALSALFAHNKLDETDNDTRDANVNKGFEILSTMEEDLRTLKAQTPQGKQEIQKELADLKAKIDATDPADTQVLDGLSQTATKLESLLATPLAEGTAAKKLGKQIETQLKDIEAATALHKEMSTHAIDKMLEGLDLDAEIGVADAQVDANDASAVAQATASAQKIITLSMRHKDRLTVDQATQLASNTANGLSQEQRAYFDAFSKARLAETEAEGLKQVNKEVLYGDPAKRQLGIKDYRERVTSALASGTKKIADRNLSMLDNFVSSHTEKLKLAQEAQAEVNQTGQAISYGKNKAGGWERQAKPFPNTDEGRKAQKAVGGFTIRPRGFSNNYIAAVEAEKNALVATKAELQAAYNLKFKPSQATAAPTTTVAATAPVASTPNTQPTQPGTTGVGSGVSQTPQVAASTPSSPATTAPVAAIPRVQVGNDPDGWLNKSAQLARNQADKSGLTQDIEDLFAQGYTANEVLSRIKERIKFVDRFDQAGWVVSVRATLGIPSQIGAEGKADFAVWKAEYNQRKMANATAKPVTNATQSTTTKTQGVNNGTQTPQAVQAAAQGPQTATAAGTTATADSQPAADEPITGGVALTGNNPKYVSKDQAKSDQATKFIGEGSTNSSTARYAKAWGDRANTGSYTAQDTVFVSAEGSRTGRVPVNTTELGKATNAGATIITDVAADRNRAYNVGERETAAFLQNAGYTEASPGRWVPQSTTKTEGNVDQINASEGNVDQINASEGNVENQAKNEQVSSSLNSAKSLSDQDHLFILKDLYPEKQIRALNETEQQLVNAALDIVKSEFGGTLEVPSRVFAHDGAKAYGWFYATNGIISVNVAGITNRLMPSVGVTDQVHAIASVIAHEMAHHRDAQLGYLSRKAGMLYAGKAVYEEAKASVAKNPVLDYWFGRLVFSHNDAQKQAFELYAQLFALYALNKELFRENLPTGYALIQQAVSAGVREAAPSSVQRVSDGGTNSGSTEESSAASTSEDGASRVQPGDQSDRVGSEEITSEPVDNTPVEPGKLQAFSVEVPEGTTFKDRNLVASDLKQSAGGDGVVTQRPLVAAKDFLSHWKKKGNGFLAQYLGKEWNKLNDKQQKLLEKFRDTAIDWAPKFQASIGKKDESKSAFYFQDMMQFLIQSTNVDGKTAHDVEENIKTAMSYALYSWVAENAARSAFNEHEDINKILNRDKDHEVSEREEELLASVGARDEVIINSLGQRAAAALGISAKQTANKDTLSRLEVALGTHIMRVMSDSGMVKRTSVTGLELAMAQSNLPSYDHLPQAFQNLFDQFVANPPLLESYRNSDLDFTGLSKDQREAVFATYKQFKELASTQHSFLKIARDGQNKLPAETASIYESVVGSQGVLDSLFSVEAGLKEPSLTPIPFNKKNTKGTRSWIPKKLADILEKLNQQASYVKEDHWLLWGKLGVDALHKMAGAKDASETVTHVSERKGIEAKNDGLLREIQRFQDFVNAAIVPQGKPVSEVGMYFSHEPWKQQRVGIETSMVNPQASKLQRFMLFQKSWATKVDPSNESQLNNFKLRVAEGFGVKTDRQNMVKSLADAEAKINDPKTQAAVQAIIETVINKGEMTAEHQAAIVAGVKEGGEKFHSMDALIALARYQHADGQPFTVHMMGEVDGVTNGPMLTHILYGAARSAKELFALINKGGFYEQDSDHKQYNVWRSEPGQKDLYESTTLKVMAHALKQLSIDPSSKPVWEAVWHFTGDLGDGIDNVPKAGRDIIKTPLTALIFGSSTYRAKLSTSEKFVSSIHRAIAELKDDDNAARIQALKQINVLLGNKAPKWSMDMSVQDMRNTKFSVRQIEAIQNTFNRTLGASVEATLKESFKGLLERRDAINASAALAYTLYQSAYDALRKEFVAKTLKPGEDLGKTGEALHDLTQEQEAELERAVVNMFPMLQTYMSQESGQDKAGLEMRKSSRRLSNQRAYRNEIVFGEGGFKPEGQSKKYQTLTVHGNEQTYEAPGVRMFSMGVHSLDSGISHFAAYLSEVLNIHDAHGTGLGNFFNAARNLNQATWNALLEYSPADQMFQALDKTIAGFAEVLSREDTKPEVAAAVKKSVQALMTKAKYTGSMEMFLSESLMDAKTTAFMADKTKLETLVQLQAIDQYALEGGNYEVTNEDRAKAQAKLDKLLEQGGDLSEQTWENVNKVSMALTGKPAFRPKTSPWGEQGKSSIASDQDLVQEFTRNGNQMTAKEAAKYLSDRLKTAQDVNGYSGFKRKLLGRVLRSMDPNTVIKYVTPDTPASEVMSKPEDNSRGWISINPATGKAEIYVLSEEHLHSGLTDETLLHEMVHAATALAIRAGQAKANEAATALVADLEQLLKAATAKVNSDPKLQAKYENMVESLDELVAWGMSDKGFQDDILKQIQLAPRPRGGVINRTISGMRQFINSLTQFLFGENTPDKRNGMQALIENTAALMKVNGDVSAEGGITTLSQKSSDPVNKVAAYSTEDIYDALDDGSVSPAFSSQLKNLLNGIVHKLHGPFGSIKAKLMESRALSPQDVWLKTLDTGKAPFASEALNAGFNISEQEAFVLEQVEVTVKAALEDNEGQTTAAYSELQKLYAEAARKLKPSDFSDPELYDFLFKVEAGANKRSDYLSRFAAVGLAHEEVSKLLQFYTDRDTRTLSDAKTLLDKLRYLFNKALTLLNGKLTNTREGMPADDKLKTLVEQLIAIEDKKRRRLIPQDKNFLSAVEEKANDLTDGVREKVTSLLKSDFVRNNKNGFIKLGAAVATVSSQGQLGQVLAGIQKIKDQHLQQKNGLIMGLINDVRGPNAWMEQLLRMRKKQEQDRKFVITETGKSVLASFSKELSTEQKAAVTSVFMRTDLKSFAGHYDMSQIQELLEAPSALQNAIIEHEAELRQFKDWQHYYIHQSKALAFQMVRGQARSAMVMLNAGNIAKLLGTRHAGKVNDAQAKKAEAIIDRLTSLYALQHTDTKELDHAKQVLRDEMNRSGGNGVELVLKLHKALEEESKATLFKGNGVLMMKGYTPEIYNPHTDVKVATTPEELRELKRQGYTNEGELKQDTADGVLPGGWVMVLRDGGLQPWQTGAMSYTGRQAKGSKMQSNYTNPFDEQGLQNANNLKDVMQAKQAEIDRMFQPNPGFNPATEKRNFMVPVMNSTGTISNWRYMMSNQLKDRALDRDSRVDQVLGMLAGSTFDKQTAGEVNRQVVEALKEHADKEFPYHPKSFVQVSRDSSDPEMRELYAMLPKETRDDIRRVWGQEGMRVPYEMLDVVFGYRKASLSSIWEKEKRNMAENALVFAVESMLYHYGRYVKGLTSDEAEDYSQRGAVIMRRAENIWQEIVRETKDTIVVKTGTVLFYNILSNMSLLTIHGVSPLEMIRHHRVAFKAARAYQADKSRLFQLQQQVDLGTLSPEQERKALVEITKLEDAIARNPVMPLIEAGLMPTIVEDVAADDDIYSYKSQLARKLGQYEDKVHPMVSKAARTVYMAHDTSAYKFLSGATQLSDFVARYTLYQHLTTKKNNPLSHEAAVREASESFINYDVPLHKSMQYFDDMGIVPFMKYTLRIQRVLVRLTRDHPARMLSAVLLNNMFDALPLVTDSGMLGRIGNIPFQWGAFKFATTLDEGLIANSALSLMQLK